MARTPARQLATRLARRRMADRPRPPAPFPPPFGGYGSAPSTTTPTTMPPTTTTTPPTMPGVKPVNTTGYPQTPTEMGLPSNDMAVNWRQRGVIRNFDPSPRSVLYDGPGRYRPGITPATGDVTPSGYQVPLDLGPIQATALNQTLWDQEMARRQAVENEQFRQRYRAIHRQDYVPWKSPAYKNSRLGPR